MLKGIDVSHWNDKAAVAKEEKDFIIVKATEGIGFKDPEMMKWVKYAWENNLVLGLYHYARPDRNTMSDEADFFVEQVHRVWDAYPTIPIFFALDWEGKSHNYSDLTALVWLRRIEEKLGAKPLFYCQQSKVEKYEFIAKADYGLWVARYNKNVGNIKPWDIWAFWQYDSRPVDRDYFNGSMEQLLKYCANDNRTPEKESTCPKECACACHNVCPLANE